MLERVYFDRSNGTRVIVEQIDQHNANYVFNSRLTIPSENFPKFERYQDPNNDGVGYIRVQPATITNVVVEYVSADLRTPSMGTRYLLEIHSVRYCSIKTHSVRFRTTPHDVR